LSFRYEGEITTSPNKQKPREFTTTRLALQEMLKEFFSEIFSNEKILISDMKTFESTNTEIKMKNIQ